MSEATYQICGTCRQPCGWDQVTGTWCCGSKTLWLYNEAQWRYWLARFDRSAKQSDLRDSTTISKRKGDRLT